MNQKSETGSGQRPEPTILGSGQRPEPTILGSGQRPEPTILDSGQSPEPTILDSGQSPEPTLFKPEPTLLKMFTLREGLCLAFCGTFLVITRAMLRLHLHIPGHAMVFTMFFLLLARGTVPKMFAATLTGFIAGVLCTLLGMGKEGPLIIIKFVVPGLVVDCGGFLYPGMTSSYLACLLVGATATACRFVSMMLIDWVMGMEWEMILKHALLGGSMNVIFGSLGSLMVPPVVRRLKVNRLI